MSSTNIFQASFPAHKLEQPRSPSEEDPTYIQIKETKACMAYSIFVVDDEPMILDMIDQALRKRGFRAKLFDSADKAKIALDEETLAGRHVDLVLLDMRLGDSSLSARDFLKCLIQRKPSCEVLVMSGQLPGNELSELVLKGAGGFIQKPVSLKELVNKVRIHASIGRARHHFVLNSTRNITRTKRDVFLVILRKTPRWH